ncbi:MAG: hypothetical protein ACE5H8_00200 [Alphaproteobacteria bacterium]
MTDNVIDFSSRHGSSTPEERPKRAKRREEEEKQHAAYQDQRRQSLKAALEQRPRMNKPRERGVVAENLWAILEQVERGGIRKSEILHAAGYGKPEDSTKRLPQYALDSDLPEEKKKERRRKLTQSTRGYIKIAQEAAKALDKQEDAFLLRLFEGTDYLSADKSIQSSEAEWCHTISDMLRGMCDWVAKKYSLDEYFSFIMNNSVLFDKEGTIIGIDPGDSRYGEFDYIHDQSYSGLDDLCWVPGILIYQVMGDVLASARFIVEDATVILKGTHPPFDRYDRNPRNLPDGVIEAKDVTARRVREIWLTIVPVGESEPPRAAFQICHALIFRGQLKDGNFFEVRVNARAMSYPITYWDSCITKLDNYPLGFFNFKEKEFTKLFKAEEKWSDYYEFVTPASCKKYLSIKLPHFAFSGEWANLEGEGPAESSHLEKFTEAPYLSVAASIEWNLGIEPDNKEWDLGDEAVDLRLDTQLAREAKRRVGTIDAYKKKVEKAIKDRKKRIARRWKL